MIRCPSCQYQNREGELYCENCGASLQDGAKASIPTRQVEAHPDESATRISWGPAHVGRGMAVLMHIREIDETVTLHPQGRIIFGRSDESTADQPDVDLTPYGALEKGVSRQHAILEIADDTVMLVDIGSSNGTFLNGQRLRPNQPRVLRDGDEVRLGKLVANIYFK